MDLSTIGLIIFFIGWLIMRKENIGRYIAIAGAIIYLVAVLLISVKIGIWSGLPQAIPFVLWS